MNPSRGYSGESPYQRWMRSMLTWKKWGEQAQSPWCNAVVLVQKKDRSLCFCIDFHKLNVRTKKGSYPLPWIQEAIKSLVGTEYFSCLDLKAGFGRSPWMRLKTVHHFTMGKIGFFECECMLFELCNVLAMFQRLMQNCVVGLNLTYCLIYLDDMIVFSKMEDKHLHCLCIVFERFREHNLKLKSTMCVFFKNKINYLAHHISKEGVWHSKENLKAVAKCAPPETYTKIQAFLGLVGHY